MTLSGKEQAEHPSRWIELGMYSHLIRSSLRLETAKYFHLKIRHVAVGGSCCRLKFRRNAEALDMSPCHFQPQFLASLYKYTWPELRWRMRAKQSRKTPRRLMTIFYHWYPIL